ncbi:hypothetical protein [Amycolatopsis cihanbeyliensis]|uniref:Uncharacterized protein n=1 Tax=Amycolatopsis cihanbeyliensis TaxID=1128664 RepID=A0A542DPT2_AMYCI|nr:hypothetical protein [Amycolatopsis cihanbeyliensis]TQJ05066.1 hypothetical protein FB471_4887 [Amycolatopsis cihanbeyliensis]
MNTRRLLFLADALIDADDSATSGFICPVPCERFGDGRISLWPRPWVRLNPSGYPIALELDLRTWLVTYHGERTGTGGLTLPIECQHRPAAADVAETFLDHLAKRRVFPNHPEHLAQWCAWWCENYAYARPMRAER